MKTFLSFFAFSTVLFAQGPDGMWLGPCEPASQGYNQTQLGFMGNHFQMVTLHHGGAACKDANIRIEASGTFAEAALTGEERDAVTNVNLTHAPTLITPLTSGIAFSMNLAGVCNIRNWKSQQTRDVSGRNCDGEAVPTVGEIRYDIYAVDNMTLYTGKMTNQNNGTSAQTRPTELDQARPFRTLLLDY